MSRRQDPLDGRPRSIPDIKTGARGLTFEMHPLGLHRDERLVIRCDDEGDVWISIQSMSATWHEAVQHRSATLPGNARARSCPRTDLTDDSSE